MWASAAQAQSGVVSAPTNIKLAASHDSSGAGGRIKLAATVALEQGGEVPCGTVRFSDETNGAILGQTDVATPSITIDSLAIGSHAIRAEYFGTIVYFPFVVEPSRSQLLTETVLLKPEVRLSSSQNPSTPGQLVMLTATVNSPGEMPKGSITFSDGNEVLAAHVMLDRGGKASFVTSALSEGTRSLVAAYEGDSAHAPATSWRFHQDVGAVRFRNALLFRPQ